MKNILKTIGNTPLVQIKNLNPNPKVNIFAKLEGFNPTGSIKDRIALAMVKKAEEQGLLTKNKIIIEASSGNTGISLAMIGAVKGYKVKIVMPESMSIERRKILKFLGAEIILVKEENWRDAVISFTKKLMKQNNNLIMLNQYENKENIKTHYNTTGKEIIDQMNGKNIDIFIAGIGTGGTITGAGKKIKENFPNVKIIGVQPKLGANIQGLKSLKEGYVPPVLNQNLIDRIYNLDQENAFQTTKKLSLKQGILAGPSSGAAMYIALLQAKTLKQGNIVVIFPDRGEKYLSTRLFQ